LSVADDTGINASVVGNTLEFTDCKANNGKAGAIKVELNTIENSGSIFSLTSVKIKNCFGGTENDPQAIYLDIPSPDNEAFLFSTTTLSYDIPTTRPILYINIYNLNNIVNGDFSRVPTFRSKFVGYPCPPSNLTEFIVRDDSLGTTYPLSELICDCIDRNASDAEQYPCSYNGSNSKCVKDVDNNCRLESCTEEFDLFPLFYFYFFCLILDFRLLINT
jgi:hypothetical protein